MTYRIFLVEDDHSIASGLQHQLEQWDFEVQVVQNFRGVLTECTAFDPHLILMDIMLPCYDGYHWCREIRRVSEVPIIFLSSASDNLNLIMAVNMGGDDFIAKPFDWNVLLAKIQALLRRTYDFGGQAAPLEHRGAVLIRCGAHLSGNAYGTDEKRVPDSTGAPGTKRKGCQPGDAHGTAVGNGQFRGRKHTDCQCKPPAEKAGQGRPARFYSHQGGHGLSD